MPNDKLVVARWAVEGCLALVVLLRSFSYLLSFQSFSKFFKTFFKKKSFGVSNLQTCLNSATRKSHTSDLTGNVPDMS